MTSARLFGFCLSLALIACDGGRPTDSSNSPTAPGGIAGTPLADTAAKLCLINDPRREVGAGLDAPGRLTVDAPTLGQSLGACANQQHYLLGAALHDVTAPIADTASLAWVNPQQVFSGLHSRVYARAFAIASPCNDQSIMFVSIDTGLMSSAVRQAVLAEVAADPDLSPHYDARNVMLSVTHTHSDPGTGLAGIGNGMSVIVSGIYQAIRDAHLNSLAQSGGGIRLSAGELLNTNINRSKPAFMMNNESERQQFLNQRGEEVQVNKRMVQLELNRSNGAAAGLINWFGVHPTVIGPANNLVSGDIKGYASLGFERLMNTDYQADARSNNFVSAFAQADEGDASPNIFIEEFPYPAPNRGGGENDLDSNAIAGIKQLAKAIELYGSGAAVSGPVDYRFARIPIDNIVLEDPAVIASLQHPAALDSDDKRTCTGVLGASFGAGAEDGPGPTVEGLKCSDEPAVLDDALADIETLSGIGLEGFPGGWPAETIPGQLGSSAVMCNVALLPPVLGDFSCQAEKPILLPRGSSELPIQLFRVGQFALLGLPWEVTTIAARRLRQQLLQELAPIGINTIVIAGLVNDYVHYLTTREEYASQQYEGASNLYGPWSLAVVTQESLKLARAMRANSERSAAPAVAARSDLSLVAGPNELANLAGSPGDTSRQPAASYTAGDTVTANFIAGHPGHDLRLQESYVYAERETSSGDWEILAQDRDPELLYIWQPLVPVPVAAERPPISSGGSAEVVWHTPANLMSGQYRLRIVGASLGLLTTEASAYEGVSNQFEILASGEACP